MRFKSGILALLVIVAAAGRSLAADVQILRIPFNPAPTSSFAYRITESTRIAWNDWTNPGQRWSQRFEITFGGKTLGGVSATIRITDVKAEEGTVNSLRFLLARAAQDEKIKVVVDPRGFVREVSDWATLEERLKTNVATLTDPATAKMTMTLLDRLNGVSGTTAVARTLFLVSGVYAAAFANDKSEGTSANWQAGSAYAIPGRSISTRLIASDGEKAIMDVSWSLTTERAVAARVAGAEVQGFLASVANDPSLADARAKLREALAGSAIELGEKAEGVFDLRSGMPRTFHHELTITVGDYRSSQNVDMELLDE